MKHARLQVTRSTRISRSPVLALVSAIATGTWASWVFVKGGGDMGWTRNPFPASIVRSAPSGQHRPVGTVWLSGWFGNGTPFNGLVLVDHLCLLRRIGTAAGAVLPSRLLPSHLLPSWPCLAVSGVLSTWALPGCHQAGGARAGAVFGEPWPDVSRGSPAGRVSESGRQISNCGNSAALAVRLSDGPWTRCQQIRAFHATDLTVSDETRQDQISAVDPLRAAVENTPPKAVPATTTHQSRG